MKRKVKKFSEQVENIRKFLEPDTDGEVMRSIIEMVHEQVEDVRTR